MSHSPVGVDSGALDPPLSRKRPGSGGAMTPTLKIALGAGAVVAVLTLAVVVVVVVVLELKGSADSPLPIELVTAAGDYCMGGGQCR